MSLGSQVLALLLYVSRLTAMVEDHTE